ncbi:MAG: hypothetical protein BWY57_01875 [Betaproteobacteria bacterium ADurb.Bin341]|nr:MAG: hypothetical protein BWY57_01875 [Betaproteobacteria bacterium ADurb.Bin341]
MRAKGTHQTLRHHPQQGGVDQVGRHPQIKQASNRRGRIVGVQGGQHQVPGQRGLDRHFSRFQIADFTDHDDVRILTHQGAHAIGKPQVDGVLHLHLVERSLDHFNRVFDRAYIDFGRRQLLQGGIKRGRLARSGRAGHQDDAVRHFRHLLPAGLILIRKPEITEIAHQNVRVKNPHHQLFAKRRRQRRQAQLDFLPVRCARLDAAILWPAFLDHVHARQQLDAAGHAGHHRHRNLVHLMQDAIDAETHDADFTARLDVDVGGALVKGILPKPVDNVNDVLVIGVELFVGLA